MTPKIAPSVLSADFTRLGEEVRMVEEGGADLLHLDVMDAHFVPNLTFGPMVIAAIDSITELKLSTHLMMSDPEPFLEDFVKAGSDEVIVHIESYPDPTRVLARIRELGAQAGLTLNPDTPMEAIEPYLSGVDVFLVMSVNPGWGGQGFMPSMLPKLTRAVELRKEHGYGYSLHIDGGIDRTTAPEAVQAGAEVLIAGSAVFKSEDPRAMVGELRRVGEEALGI
jgi:ribulose-phosphate 3-epimerase